MTLPVAALVGLTQDVLLRGLAYVSDSTGAVAGRRPGGRTHQRAGTPAVSNPEASRPEDAPRQLCLHAVRNPKHGTQVMAKLLSQVLQGEGVDGTLAKSVQTLFLAPF